MSPRINPHEYWLCDVLESAARCRRRGVDVNQVKTIKQRIAASINESLSAESESFANYLATKLMREFNITLKD